MQQRRLGQQGPLVSSLGLGCMGMSDLYGSADRGEAIATVQAALERGVTLFDTGDFYGMGHNELLLGEALRGRRDQALISVKFGALRGPGGEWLGYDTRPAAIKNFVAYSLKRLGVDHIDIYRPARLDRQVPIEDTWPPSPSWCRPATSAISAFPRWAPRPCGGPPRYIRSATCRSSIRWSRAASRRRSCQPAANWASASPPMACSPVACSAVTGANPRQRRLPRS